MGIDRTALGPDAAAGGTQYPSPMAFFVVYIAAAAGLLFIALIALLVTLIVLAVRGRESRTDRQLYRRGSESTHAAATRLR